HVRVVDLEPGALKAVDEVDHRTSDVGQAGSIDQQPDPLVLEHGVTIALLVERERVLEAGAASAADPDAQSGRFGDRRLAGQELADLLGTLIGKSDHASFSIATLHRYA